MSTKITYQELNHIAHDVVAIVLETPQVYSEDGNHSRAYTDLLEYKIQEYIRNYYEKDKHEH